MQLEQARGSPLASRFGGSLVGEAWKEGVRSAVAAAAALAGEPARDWTITVRNRSSSVLTDGPSASGAVALGILAAWGGLSLPPDIAMTGRIGEDGRIYPVGGLRLKFEAAVRGRMRLLLVPRGQVAGDIRDLVEEGRVHGLSVVEVGTLREAYAQLGGTLP